jgi:hypothetical protein
MGYMVAVYQGRERGDVPADVVVYSETYNGWADAVNRLCLEIVPKSAPIVVTGGDDMLPDPKKRAGEIAAEFVEHFGGTFGVMQPHGDPYLNARHYCGSPWMGREWIARMYGGNGPMFPGYRHNWADNEIYWLARGFGAFWSRPDLSQFHDHWSRPKPGTPAEEKPAYWAENSQGRDRADLQLFIARAWQHFPGHQPLPAPGPQRRFDAARFEREYRGLAEMAWVMQYGIGGLAPACEKRLRAGLERCAAAGCARVALYGAGTHTRALGTALMEPPANIVCIIDDDPRRRGGRLWGYPIVTPADALAMGVDAVVISSNSMEEEIADRCGPFEARGAMVVRLYGEARAVTTPAA